MDKSSEYIQMCAKASEIQKQWTPKHGDFFVGEEGKIEVWVSRVHDKRNLVSGVRVVFDNGIPKVTKYIWLPRLDQLIELAQQRGKRYELITQEFFDWTKIPYRTLSGYPRKVFDTLEKIWMAFIMQSKFKKQWDGENWISEL